MAEYIEREKIRDKLYENDAITFEGVKILNTLPTADVVKVVRCKDCKRCDLFYPCKAIDEEEPILAYYCEMFKQYRKPTDFCSYGELKGREGK